MIEVFVAGIGLRGPGMPSWPAGIALLTGQVEPSWEPPSLPPPALLAPNERRRAGTVVRLALAVAQEASDMAGLPPGATRSVFASGNGDGAVVHAILETLAGADPQVSPTQFHNSVHNAAAGYWSIGARSKAAANSLGCHDATAAAALLKAAAEVAVEHQPVLLCIYDVPLPEPLARVRPTEHVFGVGLLLMPDPPATPLARLRLDWQPETTATPWVTAGSSVVRALYASNPTARILPLLETIARRETAVISLQLLDGQVVVNIAACSTARASSP
jgi:hypothetical protein